ncbi:MAG: transporter substrate-binding domain-containing protein [bacterium]|nr:transporter substrate-binding domain-containing protein [bacterium]
MSIKYFSVMLVMLGLLIGCPKANNVAQSSRELILGTNGGYPPYENYNNKGELEGFDIDVANEIAKKLGKKLIIKDMSFDALILSLNQNKVDMVMAGMSITPTREKEITMVAWKWCWHKKNESNSFQPG